MKDRFIKLIDVKSIVTLILTLAFVIMSFIGNVTQEFITIYTMIISFYFGLQTAKKEIK